MVSNINRDIEKEFKELEPYIDKCHSYYRNELEKNYRKFFVDEVYNHYEELQELKKDNDKHYYSETVDLRLLSLSILFLDKKEPEKTEDGVIPLEEMVKEEVENPVEFDTKVQMFVRNEKQKITSETIKKRIKRMKNKIKETIPEV